MRVATVEGHWLNTFSVEEVWRSKGKVFVRTMAGNVVELEEQIYDLVDMISSEWDLGLEH